MKKINEQVSTQYNMDIEPIPNKVDGEGLTEVYHKTVKLRISDSQSSWTLKVWEEVYQEFVKQLVPGMTVSEKMKLVNIISKEFKSKLL